MAGGHSYYIVLHVGSKNKIVFYNRDGDTSPKSRSYEKEGHLENILVSNDFHLSIF